MVIRFATFSWERVAFSGDISKMFLQILLPKKDTRIQRFFWRNLDTSTGPTTYALQRVPFGNKLSPDMVSFVMLKMAKEDEKEFHRAATILKRERYVGEHPNITQNIQQMFHQCALNNIPI